MGIAAGRILAFQDLGMWEARAFASGAQYIYRRVEGMIFRHTCDDVTRVQCETWFPEMAAMQEHRERRARGYGR